LKLARGLRLAFDLRQGRQALDSAKAARPVGVAVLVGGVHGLARYLEGTLGSIPKHIGLGRQGHGDDLPGARHVVPQRRVRDAELLGHLSLGGAFENPPRDNRRLDFRSRRIRVERHRY
jgi:hypothetical protein